jgi:penicillin-binding protein 1A
MAKDDSFETRFPLRRPVDDDPVPRTPAPAKRWTPPAAEDAPPPKSRRASVPVEEPPAPPPRRSRREAPPADEPLELMHGLPPAGEWTMPPAPSWTPRRAAPPPPPPPPPTYFPEPQPAGMYTTNLPVVIKKRNWLRWAVRGVAGMIILFVVAVAWLALTAPLSKSLQPPAPPSITLLSAEGTPIAQRGAVIGPPIDAEKLPPHVRNAFVAIEDRRFFSHWGVDARGTTRAVVNNIFGGGTQGGSTITQQLAKNAFLDSSRTVGRKFQEALIAFWLEAWLTKDQILSRYLSYVYFGDNAYGLSAAAKHYFGVAPEDLTPSQATLLAGLVQAPSRLAPTGNMKGARERQKLVIAAMVDTGLVSEDEAREIGAPRLNMAKSKPLPNGGYFADWVLPQARDRAGGVATQQTVTTTLEMRTQRAAERAVKSAGLRKAQIAIVAMRPDGRVVAMVGGTDYAKSPFNRATQARRQPGSTFKLFVYLAALRAGMTPDTMVDDSPVSFGGWSPKNSNNRYAGQITLQQAFARSSNVVAARLTRRLGVNAVKRAARDLGISTPIGDEASIGLGTSTVSLLELTAAYAAVARGAYPIRPQALSTADAGPDWLGERLGGPSRFPPGQLEDLRSMMESVVQSGTGRSAALAIPAFGKTGTTQDNRDAWFVGYAGGLVVGVWVGNDDNSPNAGLSGSGIPAKVWRNVMVGALNLPATAAPPPVVENVIDANGTVGFEELVDGLIREFDEGSIDTEVDSGDPDAPPPEEDEREPRFVPVRPGPEFRREPPREDRERVLRPGE